MPNDPHVPSAEVKDATGAYVEGPGRDVTRTMEGDIVSELGHLSLLRVTGADATSFLQGQLTNDVVSAQDARYAAYCTAQGRALALFLVVRVENGFLLKLRHTLAATIANRLRMFVLRAKVEIEVADTLSLTGLYGPKAPALLAAAGLPLPAESEGATAVANTVVVVRRPGTHPRFEILAPRGDDAVRRLMGLARRVGYRAWVWLDIRSGLPDLVPTTSDLFVPQMLNVDALQGISFSKGCYPGQEIVARTHYLGKLKQRMYLARAASPAPLRPGVPLYAPNFPGQAAGHIVEAELAADGRTDLLAVIQIASAHLNTVQVDTPDGPYLQLESLPYPLPPPSG
ncbi:MAG: CAF17-like 4Fe-4S cluster assembly/insertion protein YgfZ [Acidiferrobacteraceae bacterium]